MAVQSGINARVSGKEPLVSIITPTLNSEKCIKDNILSIRSQTYRNIEHIIIDGCSTDATLAVVEEAEPEAIVISEKDQGISDAFNKGLKLAKGDIIAILNSDDYYAHDQVIERIVELFSSLSHIKMIYGKVSLVEQETGQPLAVYGEQFSMKKMLKEIITPHPAIFATKQMYEAVGAFSLECRVAMDHEYFLRATELYDPYFLNEVLTVMRWGGYSVRNIYRAHREVYRTQRRHGVHAFSALSTLIYGYVLTTLSLYLQKIGLQKIVLFYRKWRRKL